jgi:hypothetical protein
MLSYLCKVTLLLSGNQHFILDEISELPKVAMSGTGC